MVSHQLIMSMLYNPLFIRHWGMYSWQFTVSINNAIETRQAMNCNVMLWHVHITIVAVEKRKGLNMMNVCLYPCLHYLACKLHFVLHCIILSSVACLAVPYFFKLSHWHNFWAKVIEHKMCVWCSLQLMSETRLILRIIQWDVIINLRRPSFNASLIPVRF